MTATACDRMERWLDGGRPREGAAAAADGGALEAHAAGCPRCGPALAAAVALESALRGEPTARAPQGLAGAVMARIAAEGSGHPDPAALRAGVPARAGWWVRAASEPWTIAGAAGVLVVVAARGRLEGAARALAEVAPRLDAPGWAPPPWLDQAAARWLEASASLAPHLQAALALGAAGAASAVGWLLYRWSEALVTRAVR